MDESFDLAEAALPYDIRHSIWDPDEVESQLEDAGMYSPDSVYLFSVPGSEQDIHNKQVKQLLEDIDDPDTVYFNEDNRENIADVLDRLDSTEEVPISYPEDSSRQADFQALNQYFDPDETFLGVAIDYTVPRNHREASTHLDNWNGPENGFAFQAEDETEPGISPRMYLVDRMNTRKRARTTPDFSDRLEMKDGNHFVIGTTYSQDFSDYSAKFGLGPESELVRSVVPQKAKDMLKDAVNEF